MLETSLGSYRLVANKAEGCRNLTIFYKIMINCSINRFSEVHFTVKQTMVIQCFKDPG